MKYKLNLVVVLILILFSGVILGGCYKSEQEIKKEVEEKTGLRIEKGNIYTYKDKNGDLIMVELTKKRLPNGFSKVFPVLKNGIIVNGYRRTFKGLNSYSAQWKTKDSLDTVKNWYLDKLKNSGWNKISGKEISRKKEKVVLINFDKNKYKAKITISSKGESKSTSVYVYLDTKNN
jgi:hypothetical protein